MIPEPPFDEIVPGEVVRAEPRISAGVQWDDWTIGLGIVVARSLPAGPVYGEGVPGFVTFRVGPAWLSISARRPGQAR